VADRAAESPCAPLHRGLVATLAEWKAQVGQEANHRPSTRWGFGSGIGSWPRPGAPIGGNYSRHRQASHHGVASRARLGLPPQAPRTADLRKVRPRRSINRTKRPTRRGRTTPRGHDPHGRLPQRLLQESGTTCARALS
jgi:hypothetical protein